MRTWAVIATLLLCAACDRISNVATPPPEYDGAFVIVELETNAAHEQYLDEMSEQMATTLRAAGVRYNGRGVSDGVIRLRLVDATDVERGLAALAPISGHLTVSTQPDGVIEARLNDAYVAGVSEDLAQRTIPLLQQRLDRRVATAEAYAPGRIIIKTTEDVIPDSVHYVLTQQGRLTFHLVRDVSPEEAASGRLPSGTMLVAPFDPASGQQEIVERRAMLTSDHLTSASPSTDPQTGEFVLSFQLDDQGRNIFCRITREHTGQRFAILIDNQVITAPRINEPICGGTGQISGNFTAESANELAMILRVHGMPAPLRIVEEHDAIRVAPH